MSMLFFFFQAEDGIRDDLVTGVQTCALPISRRAPQRAPPRQLPRQPEPLQQRPRRPEPPQRQPRSEERRVGKECRSRGSPYHKKKKKKKVYHTFDFRAEQEVFREHHTLRARY